MSLILIVEDEQHLAEGLRFNLEAEGYGVEIAGDGETALEILRRSPDMFEAVVLDVMLPGKDGFEVAAELRQSGQFVPILMLTARNRPEDVLRGFEAGADDYLPKPFELAILIARLKGLLRRREWFHRSQSTPDHPPSLPPEGNPPSLPPEGNPPSLPPEGNPPPDEARPLFTFSGKTADFGSLELRVGGKVVRLTLMEAELLRYLVKNEGQALSRSSMLEAVWGLREDTDTRAIDNFIVRLRKYIEDEPATPRHLLTVRGVGYRFVAEPEKQ